MLEPDSFAAFLETVPPSVDVHFSGFAEPWHNPYCTRMVEHAVARGHSVALFTTTDGMNDDDIERIARLRLKRIVVHLPDAFSEMRLDPDDAYVERISRIEARMEGRIEYLTLGLPHPAFSGLDRRRYSVSMRIQDRAGNLSIEERTIGTAFPADEISSRLSGRPLRCRKDRMTSNVLLPNGELFACAMDYGLEHPLGNLGQQTYAEILAGKANVEFLRRLCDAPHELICSRCEYAFPGRYSPDELHSLMTNA